MALQNFSIQPMKTFLQEKYQIPNYQREYAWEKDEVSDFLRDIDETRKDTDSVHFFGQVVVHNDEENKKKFIIDGQQRTTTSMIFVRVLQLFYSEIYKKHDIKAANKKENLIDNFIGEYSDEEKSLHLIMNDPDNDYYIQSIILTKTPITKKADKKSCERMRVAFNMIYDQIKDEIGQYDDPSDQVACLNSYYDAFTDRFKIMYIEATKLEEAFVIFETLNARGKDLETADLLKNFVFSKSQDISAAQKQWASMINKLDNVDPTTYIRHYWNSSESFVREKGLYRAIVNHVKKPKDASELLDELDRLAWCYHDMCCPDDCDEFKDEELIQALQSLKLLKAKTFYPVILAMKQAKECYSESDIAKVAKCIETYVFRNFTVCGRVANSGETFLSNIALRIYSDLNSPDLICDAIKANTIGDDEFKTLFKMWSSTNKEVIRYILRKINKVLDPNTEISLNNNDVHIEHIMPVDNEKWKVPENLHQEYLWKLGNLTLLSGTINKKIQNDVFNIKVDEYKKSKIQLNYYLYKTDKGEDRTTWAVPDDIIARQAALVELAVDIWNL